MNCPSNTLLGCQPVWLMLLSCIALIGSCRPKNAEPPPEQYRLSGAFIKTLPYYNPDSCVLLIRRDVPPRWQGTAYESLFLDGPEDSPMALGFQHLDLYEKNFPSDTAHEFTQLWRGRLYIHLGKFDSARICIEDSYQSSIQHNRYLRAGDAQEALAAMYYGQGNTLDALRSHLVVYEAVKNLDSTQSVRKAVALFNLASIYAQSNNYREAKIWTQRVFPLVSDESKPNLHALKVGFYEHLATIYGNLNQPDSALISAQKALDLHEKYQTHNSRPNLLTSLGNAYKANQDCHTALRYLLEAQRTMHNSNPAAQATLMVVLAEAYQCLGRLDSAEILFKQALHTPKINTVAHAHSYLSEVYAQQGHYKAAYETIQIGLKLRRRYFNDEKILEIAVAKAELELELAKHQAAELEQRHQNERLQKLLVALALVFALSASIVLYFRQRGRQRIVEQEKKLLAQEKALAEALAQLKTQELERSQVALKNTQQELDHTALLLQMKNQFIEALEMRLNSQHLAPEEEEAPSGPSENRDLRRMKILTDDDWSSFRQRFEQQMPGVLSRLTVQYSDLSSAEIRLFLLLKLRFDTLEISDTLGISKASVWRSRHRLSKKLNLQETGDLDEFVQGF